MRLIKSDRLTKNAQSSRRKSVLCANPHAFLPLELQLKMKARVVQTAVVTSNAAAAASETILEAASIKAVLAGEQAMRAKVAI